MAQEVAIGLIEAKLMTKRVQCSTRADAAAVEGARGELAERDPPECAPRMQLVRPLAAKRPPRERRQVRTAAAVAVASIRPAAAVATAVRRHVHTSGVYRCELQ